MSGLTLSMAELIGTALQSVLFGLYIALFIGCLFVLLRKHGLRSRRGQVNKVLVTITITLFLLITSHWCICIARIFRAFTYYATLPGGSDAYLEYAGNPTYVAKTSLYVAQMFAGDITMVYRLYIVWGRSWRIIVAPVITSIALLVSGVAVIHSFATIQPGTNIFTSTAGHWIVTVFATSLSTNLIVTILITYRIWSVNRRVLGPVPSNLMHVAAIVMESAILYTIFLTTTHVSYLAKANFQFTALDMTSPIIGIAFSFIIVRAGLGLEVSSQSTSARATPGRGGHGNPAFALSPIEVNVSTQVDQLYTHSLDDRISTKRSPDDVPPVESEWEA